MQAYLTKSDFIVARTCRTKLYYRKAGYPSLQTDNRYLDLLEDGGYMVEAMARVLYGPGQDMGFSSSPETADAETRQALRQPNATLFQATLLSGAKLTRSDIIVKRGNVVDLIEVKAKSFDGTEASTRAAENKPSIFRTTRAGHPISSEWSRYLEDIAFQVLVIRECLPKLTIRPFLLMPDQSKTTAIDALCSCFEIIRPQVAGRDEIYAAYTGDVDSLVASHFLTQVDVSDEVSLIIDDVATEADALSASLAPNVRKIDVPISLHCRDCEFNTPGQDRNGFADCWGDLATVDPHIFDLYRLRDVRGQDGPAADELISQGRVSLFDVDLEAGSNATEELGPTAERQMIQITHTRNNSEWRSEALAGVLASFDYPLHFVDFETSSLCIPCHAGMHPYETVAFQWSCHTIPQPGAVPVHDDYINTEDGFPNFAFAEALKTCIEGTGTMLTWAAHERTVLREIARQMQRRGYANEAVQSWITGVTDGESKIPRLVDMHRLTLDHYFHPLMKGSTSIKQVAHAVWETNADVRRRLPEYVSYDDGRLISPYEALSTLQIGGEEVRVREGTGAVLAYQAMMYGVERSDEKGKKRWKQLLADYCKLDTVSMVMVWWHWTGVMAGAHSD